MNPARVSALAASNSSRTRSQNDRQFATGAGGTEHRRTEQLVVAPLLAAVTIETGSCQGERLIGVVTSFG